jgi:hypothetical protein
MAENSVRRVPCGESGTFVRRFTGIRFAPAGPTNDPDIPHATSLIDYVVRRLAADHLKPRCQTQQRHPVRAAPVILRVLPTWGI